MYKDIVKAMEEGDFSELVKGRKGYFDEIVKLFGTYFENEDNLKRFSYDYLVQDYINYEKNYFDGIDNTLLEVISFFHKAKEEKPILVYKGMARFQAHMVDMGNKYWSMCKMQRDFSGLETYEYIAGCFELIENVCEILIKKYFSLLIYMLRILKDKIPDWESIQNMKFGNMYNELIQAGILENMFKILNSEISISNWRNIACHKSYEVVEGKIIGRYGEMLDKAIVIESKDALFSITQSIYRVSQVLTLSTKLFLYDNIYEIREQMDELGIDIVNTRDEDWQLILVTELFANGFKVLEIKDEEELSIIVQDMTNDDIKERIIGIPLVGYKAWILTGRKSVKVTYVDLKGKPSCRIGLDADICEKVANYEEEWIYLAEKMSIERFV